MPGGSKCTHCGEKCDYICERCTRCEKCDGAHDRTRQPADQHLGKWLYHRGSNKGVALQALVDAGHKKGDWS